MSGKEWDNIISWVLKVLVVPVAIYLIKLRDMVLKSSDRLDAHDKLFADLIAQVSELKKNRTADLIEYNAALTTARSLDSMMDNKLKVFFAEAALARKQDYQELEKTINNLNQTLGRLDTSMGYVVEDVKELKEKR